MHPVLHLSVITLRVKIPCSRFALPTYETLYAQVHSVWRIDQPALFSHICNWSCTIFGCRRHDMATRGRAILFQQTHDPNIRSASMEVCGRNYDLEPATNHTGFHGYELISLRLLFLLVPRSHRRKHKRGFAEEHKTLRASPSSVQKCVLYVDNKRHDVGLSRCVTFTTCNNPRGTPNLTFTIRCSVAWRGCRH